MSDKTELHRKSFQETNDIFILIKVSIQQEMTITNTYASNTTPVLLPGKSHGWRSLVGCSPWGHEEWDTTE